MISSSSAPKRTASRGKVEPRRWRQAGGNRSPLSTTEIQRSDQRPNQRSMRMPTLMKLRSISKSRPSRPSRRAMNSPHLPRAVRRRQLLPRASRARESGARARLQGRSGFPPLSDRPQRRMPAMRRLATCGMPWCTRALAGKVVHGLLLHTYAAAHRLRAVADATHRHDASTPRRDPIPLLTIAHRPRARSAPSAGGTVGATAHRLRSERVGRDPRRRQAAGGARSADGVFQDGGGWRNRQQGGHRREALHPRHLHLYHLGAPGGART